MLADLSSLREPVLLEQLGGGGEEETALRLPSGGHLGDRLDETAAGLGDLGERALQAGPRDPAAAMALVDEDAGDPPARPRRRVLRVLPVVLEPELIGTAVLTPTLGDAVLVEDERGMRPTRPDQLLLQRARIADAALVLGVKADAPTPSVDPVVALDQLRKCVPRRCVERTRRVRGPVRPAVRLRLSVLSAWPSADSVRSLVGAALR